MKKIVILAYKTLSVLDTDLNASMKDVTCHRS